MIKLIAKVQRPVLRNSLQKSFVSSLSKDSTDNDVFDDSNTKYTSEEINRIRDKSRLPERIKKIHFAEEMTDLDKPFHYEVNNLRRYYGRFGKASGLNPGLCWPTPEELQFKMEYKSLAYPSLQEMVSRIQHRKNAETREMRKREERVEENMKKLITLNKEMEERAAKKETAAIAQKLKKEQLIDEVREFFGYNLSPNDPRVRDLIERRQEEKSAQEKALKKKKSKFGKKESFDYMKQVGVLTQRHKKKPTLEEPESDDD